MQLLVIGFLCMLAAMLVLAAALPFLVLLFVVGLVVGCFAFWLWMLVSAIQNKGVGDGEKIGWVLAIIFLHCLGSLLYFFIGHPKRKMALAEAR